MAATSGVATSGKIRVGVDLDGVVADFTGGWTKLYNAEFGTSLTPDLVTTWDAPEQLTHFGSMTGFWRWARTAANHRRSLFADLEPYPGAVAGLRSLLDVAHVAIITTKPTWAIPDTLDWLARLRLPLREIHITSDKPAVPCAVYLEDSPAQLAALRRRRPEAVVCRFVRPGTARSTAVSTSATSTISSSSSQNSGPAADR